MKENWVNCQRVFLVENILPLQTKFGKRNIDFFIITLTYRYMKNSQSVFCSAIGGVDKIVNIYIYTDMYDNEWSFLSKPY